LIFRLKKQEVVEYLRQGTPEAQQQALGETVVSCYSHLRLQPRLNSIVAMESATSSIAVHWHSKHISLFHGTTATVHSMQWCIVKFTEAACHHLLRAGMQNVSGMTMHHWQRMHTQKLTASSSIACCY